jgi:hypothetical protein
MTHTTTTIKKSTTIGPSNTFHIDLSQLSTKNENEDASMSKLGTANSNSNNTNEGEFSQ